jgi:hypothetical protein
MNWFEGDLAGKIQDVLRDPSATVRELFNPAELDKLLAAHFSGRARHTEVIFRLLTLELWQQRFIRQPQP